MRKLTVCLLWLSVLIFCLTCSYVIGKQLTWLRGSRNGEKKLRLLVRISVRNCMLLLRVVVLPLCRRKAGTLCVGGTHNYCISLSSRHRVPLHAIDVHVLTLHIGRGGPGRTFGRVPHTDVGRMWSWWIVGFRFSCMWSGGVPKCWGKCARQFLRLRHWKKIKLLLRILLAESITRGVVWRIGYSVCTEKPASSDTSCLHLKIMHTNTHVQRLAAFFTPIEHSLERNISSWY